LTVLLPNNKLSRGGRAERQGTPPNQRRGRRRRPRLVRRCLDSTPGPTS